MALVPIVAGGCDLLPGRDVGLPDPDSAAARYSHAIEGELRGNVLILRVQVPDEMRRGGRLWARGGPYFYLFSESTEDLFLEHGGLAAIRTVTVTPDGEEIARATLSRGELNEYEWRHAKNLAARAQLEGTENPRRVEELALFGERRTEHEYSPDFVPPR